MSFFSRLVLGNEFAIEEKPLPVYEPSLTRQAGTEKDGLIAAISEILREQENLSQINETLKAAQSSGGGAETERLVQRFLPWLDGFDRILEGLRSMPPSAEVNNWLKSLEGLYYRVASGLERVGLEPMKCLGKPVDLNCMEVVDYRVSPGYPHDVVIQEVKRGYLFRGRVLRDAQVAVASNERGA